MLDEAPSGSGGGCPGYGRIPCRKPLLLLDLDALPRRIPEHYVESPAPSHELVIRVVARSWEVKHIGIGDVPVEERVLFGNAPYFLYDLARY